MLKSIIRCASLGPILISIGHYTWSIKSVLDTFARPRQREQVPFSFFLSIFGGGGTYIEKQLSIHDDT